MFRDVLGHFPTGVVVITARDPEDEPVAMVVGSFTSVSLDPPLVAFLPTRTSSSYERMRGAEGFCVNVLSEDQEELCRRLASRDPHKFDGVAWRPSPAGNPILDGSVAWIDCTVTARHTEGDHDIVIGAVTALDTEEPAGPLLFFQGGYGRFDRRREDDDAAQLSRQLQIADATRPHLEALARETGLETYTQSLVGGDLLILAAASGSERSVREHIGRRLPLRMPYGATFPAFDQSLVSRWTPPRQALPAGDAGVEERLERVRRRGWSVGLVAQDHDEHWATISRHGRDSGHTGVDVRIRAALESIADAYEPADDVLDTGALSVRILSAPVFDSTGAMVLSIVLFGFPPDAEPAQVRRWTDRLTSTAEAASKGLSVPGAQEEEE
ncbi:flavin reductase family protein [Microbacterium abyssi]|uniref:flavin reductase family protein n=1 Tax=Microbacterium abyssi TaxID=2782166 RepID=UPI001E28BFED|nr:flavin reductase family protein [Microbacterium sp. A18JL241]